MSEIILNDDQNAVLDKFYDFMMKPDEPVMVIRGYSGTGKSTLVHTLLDRLPGYIKMIQLIDPDYTPLEIQLTATTHKAAENFSQITGMDVSTIHSFLSLRVSKDFRTGRTELAVARGALVKYEHLIFVDEASMIDSNLLSLIFQQVKSPSKIVFIGDPAQLAPVKSTTTPVFSAGFPEAALTKVMRQQVNGVAMANPITELATLFRYTVETGEWPTNFKPDGQYIVPVSGPDFQAAIDAEFTRPDWIYRDSKILAWTNDKVIDYNAYVRNLLKGDPQIQVGDYVDNNSYVVRKQDIIKTDQTVLIIDIGDEVEIFGVKGKWMTIENGTSWFLPNSREEKNRALLQARRNDDFKQIFEIETWVDFRAVFAQTVNKSQGSTYDRVFIDLDNISKCTNGNLIARMLYVAISRARKQVFLKGDIKK